MNNNRWCAERHLPLIVGHRGCSATEVENTLSAFALARAHAVEAVELDVQRTLDGVVVVFHDETLSRLVGDQRAITDLRYAEIAEMEIQHERFPSSKHAIATLDMALEVLGEEVLLDIEIKSYNGGGSAIVDLVLERVASHGIENRVMLSSFSPRTLLYCATRARSIPRAIIYDRSSHLSLARVVRATHAKPRYARVATQRNFSASIPVIPWTVNDVEIARSLVRRGARGIVTDDPVFLRSALGDLSLIEDRE